MSYVPPKVDCAITVRRGVREAELRRAVQDCLEHAVRVPLPSLHLYTHI